MGQGFYRSIKTKKLLALLIRQGFVSKDGSRHGKYVKDDIILVVPRHRSLSPGVSKQICDVLEKDFDIPKSELKKLF